MTTPSVLVVGAGISGLSAARVLAERGVSVRVVERGHVAGGRMATRRWNGRPVDLGASYFTAEPDRAFDAVVQDWLTRGLAREWTDRFAVADSAGIRTTTTGPMRYASATGLRQLVTDLGTGLDIRFETTAQDVLSGSEATILAMPDLQARRLLPAGSSALEKLGGHSTPTIAVALRWDERAWPHDLHGVFVNDSDAIGFIADDGDRRGDGAPVLVVHSSAELAREHLDDPDAALPAIVAATLSVLGIDIAPVLSYVHRWSFAKPAHPHDEPFLFDPASGLGVCGDGWGVDRRSAQRGNPVAPWVSVSRTPWGEAARRAGLRVGPGRGCSPK